MRTSQGVKCAGSHQVEDDGTMLALKRDGRAQDALTACAELVRQSDGCGESERHKASHAWVSHKSTRDVSVEAVGSGRGAR